VAGAQVAWGTNVGWDFTCLTDIDLTGDQFKFVYLDTDGYLEVCTAGRRATGVIQDAPVGTTATPIGSQVRMGGPTKIQCGGAFQAGDLLASDSAGKAVKYTGASVYTGTPYTVSGSQVLGVALAAGSTGTDSVMLFQPSGLVAAGD
jgi:hypothetical protein